MPLQATSGAASYDAFGGGAAAVPTFVEDVFSTFLHTGTGATQTITNGIDLSTKGGLVWCKMRSSAGYNHALVDTARGASYQIHSNTTGTGPGASTDFTSFNTTGFTLGAPDATNNFNASAETYASWTFRKQPKFFDVQTFTYPSSGSITVSHNLASTPGCVMVKNTDGADGWYVYHRMANNGTNPSNYILQLNTTGAQINNFASWITVGSTSITFPSGALNPGSNFVMYLFAHDAGGFGLTGTDNVISCGTFTTDGSGEATVNLGYEPQWLMTKRTDNTSGWIILDNMRQWVNGGDDKYLIANGANAELTFDIGNPTATGFFTTAYAASAAHIYIAIRRGPMKVPTVGTSVFKAISRTGTGAAATITGVGFAPDLVWAKDRDVSTQAGAWDRLRGVGRYLVQSNTYAETSVPNTVTSFNMDGVSVGVDSGAGSINWSGDTFINWFFKRAPNFFDEVCYTGTEVNRTLNHNLSVAPELIIIKSRTSASSWVVGAQPLGWSNTAYLLLETTNATNAYGAINCWNNTTPTSSVFTLGSGAILNSIDEKYVAYLFATCAGVSKVFSYTGNGSSQTINCGFTGGARFVLIKRTDSTGDWYIWDSVRGIVSGNDPHLSLNSNAVEVTTDDSVDTDSTGFIVNQLAATNVNVTSATYIGIAIA